MALTDSDGADTTAIDSDVMLINAAADNRTDDERTTKRSEVTEKLLDTTDRVAEVSVISTADDCHTGLVTAISTDEPKTRDPAAILYVVALTLEVPATTTVCESAQEKTLVARTSNDFAETRIDVSAVRLTAAAETA
jgi:hypothetical protein